MSTRRNVASAGRTAVGALVVALSVGGTSFSRPAQTSEGQLRNARLDAFLLESMRFGGLDAWITLSREGNFDPLSVDFGFRLGRAALIFIDRGGARAERWALISSLDEVVLRESKIYDRIETFERDESFEEKLSLLLKELDSKRIGINRSETSGIADGLSASYYDVLVRALQSGGAAADDRLVSSEKAVLSLRSKRLPEEIEMYRRAAQDTEQVLLEALTGNFIRPGKTTQTELRDHVQELARVRGYSEMAWDEESCPGVYSGIFKDLSHASPKEVVIQPGDILWVDFGVRFSGYATDMIRASYVLRSGETEAPPEVQRMFDTLRRTNEAAKNAMKPGVEGFRVDAIAREMVVEAGYPEFFHATGHPVGREVHGAGPSLGPRSPRYGAAVELKLEPGQIFAVEPSVMRPSEDEGGTYIINMEEEVLITEYGSEYLAPHQTELILIPSTR